MYLGKKYPKFFPAGPFFLVLQLNVYRSAHILRNLPCPEKFLVTRLDYVKPIKRDLDPEPYVIHIGTNNLGSDKTPDEIFSEILRLIKELKTDKNKIVVSTFVPRGDAYNTKAEKVNTLLKEYCENNVIDKISHDNINVKKHLNKGKLHLNDKGISSFVRNFRDFLKVFETA